MSIIDCFKETTKVTNNIVGNKGTGEIPAPYILLKDLRNRQVPLYSLFSN